MNWTKLRGRSFAELRLRARQGLAAWSERVGISTQVRVPDDRRLTRLLATALSLERFRDRVTPRFFPTFGEREAIVAALRARWPQLEGRVLEAADLIRRGQFDLLGRSRLTFGSPVDWHWDPLSGERLDRVHWSRIDPASLERAADVKLIWELNRHQYFVTLGKAYWYTRDERYAATFVEHLMSWMDENPPKTGINWASSLELALRAISWIWGLYCFQASPTLREAVFQRALKFLFVHGRHIETYLSRYYSPNTHLTGEALGLLYLGTLFPEFRVAQRWQRAGWSILVEQLDKQVRPDGSYFEQSTYYHRYTTDFYLHASILGRLNGLPVEAAIHGKLRALLAQLMYLTQPDGRTPLLGDDDGGRLLVLDDRAPDDFRAALATGAVLFDRPDFAYVAGEAAEETLWLMGAGGVRAFEALQRVPPAATARAFADGGYYVMRDGWGRDASSLVVDCGPHGGLTCGHAHADALGVTLVVRGTPVLVDPGTYTYRSPGGLRDHFRSSAAHNTVTVAGEPSSIPSGPFSWRHVGRSAVTDWRPGARCDYFEAVDDGYARLTPPALHRRSVFHLRGDYWIVRDRICTAGEHDVALHLQFAPGVALEALSATRGVGRWGPECLEIGVFGHAGVMRIGEGLVSSSYGALSPAATCTFTARGRGPRDVVSFFVPRSDGEQPLTIEERPAPNGRAFVIASPGVEDVLLLGADGDTPSGDLASDAAWAWVRRAPDAELPSEFVVLQGRRLTWRGRMLLRADAPVPYIAVRLQGSWLHVDVDAHGRCDVALPGAEGLVVSGARTATVGILGAPPSVPVQAGVVSSEAWSSLSVS